MESANRCKWYIMCNIYIYDYICILYICNTYNTGLWCVVCSTQELGLRSAANSIWMGSLGAGLGAPIP